MLQLCTTVSRPVTYGTIRQLCWKRGLQLETVRGRDAGPKLGERRTIRWKVIVRNAEKGGAVGEDKKFHAAKGRKLE